jgi:beta-1,4-mannosyltransferase
MALARNLRRHRIALVRTLYDSDKRGSRRLADRLARRVLDKATTAFTVFDESVSTPAPDRTTVIPHAHFRDRYIGYPRGSQVRGRVLCIAAGELPNNARDLLAIPCVADTTGATLRLAGVASNALEADIRSALARHPSLVSARLERLSDGALLTEVDDAELVVVPKVQSLDELQMVYLALSVDRPVVTRLSEQMRLLATSVGPGWVHLSDGPITAQTVDDAFTAFRSPGRSSHPNLDGRDLASTGAAYATVFRMAASTHR